MKFAIIAFLAVTNAVNVHRMVSLEDENKDIENEYKSLSTADTEG